MLSSKFVIAFLAGAVVVAGIAPEARAANRPGGGGFHGGGGGGFHAPAGGGFHAPAAGGGFRAPAAGGFRAPAAGGGFHAPVAGFHPGGGFHSGAIRAVGGRGFAGRGRGLAARPARRGLAARPADRRLANHGPANRGLNSGNAGRAATRTATRGAGHKALAAPAARPGAARNAAAAPNALGGGRLTGRQFAHNEFAARNFRGLYNFNRGGFNRNAFGDPTRWNGWGRHFWGAGWNRWGRGWGGWAGPVFWPFLYGDLFSYAFWPDDYYDPFWAYGPDFVLASIFAPGPYFGPDYGYAPDYYDRAGAPNVYYGSGQAPNLATSDREALQQVDAAAAQSCSGLAPDVNDLPIAQIRQTIHPSAEQAALLDQLDAASKNAAKAVAASCPTQIPLTPVDRLDAAEKRINAMIQAVQIVSAPLRKFYDSLSDQQKQQFDRMSARRGAAGAGDNNPQALCGNEASSATDLPVQRIEQVVQPNAQQQQAFDDLKAAAAKAARDLQASCPTAMPTTPVARLDAAAARLKAVAAAMDAIRPALQSFYASLGDEQKARFNTMGPPQSAAAASQTQGAR